MTRRKQTAYAKWVGMANPAGGAHPVLAEAGARWAVEVGANRGGAGGNQGLSPTSVIARGKTGSFLGGLFISQLLSNMTFNWCKWMPQPTGPRALCDI